MLKGLNPIVATLGVIASGHKVDIEARLNYYNQTLMKYIEINIDDPSKMKGLKFIERNVAGPYHNNFNSSTSIDLNSNTTLQNYSN